MSQERAFLEAQIGSIRQILRDMPANDFLGRIGMGARLAKLQAELETVESTHIETKPEEA